MYSISQKPGDHKLDVQLLKLIKTFSKKTINQLAVVPEFEMLISLSGIKIWPMEFQNYEGAHI